MENMIFVTIEIWKPEPELQNIQLTGHFLVLVFKWFGFLMVSFIAIKLLKLDGKPYGHSISSPFFK
jgi:hypothetical protein